MSRTGALSDESILKHCQIYRPIPLKAAQSILHQDLHTPFGNKKLKYQVLPNRPKNFDTMAKSLARVAGNDTIRENLEKRYNEQVQSALAATPQVILPQRATAVNLQRSSSEAFTPMNTFDDLVRRATELFEEVDAPATPATPATPSTPSRPMAFPRISIQELIDRRTPKPDDESAPEDETPQPERMTSDALARREALLDSGIASRALQTPGRTVLRNRAIVSAAAAEQERSARAAAAAQSAFGRRSERINNQSVMSVPTAIQQLEAQLMGLQDPPDMGFDIFD